jgi:hypothetical protein
MRDRIRQTDPTRGARKPTASSRKLPEMPRQPSPTEEGLTPGVLLTLQRTAGNAAVAGLIGRAPPLAGEPDTGRTRAPSRATARLGLPHAVGNIALASPPVVQRGLIPLDAQDRPGRLRDEERTLKDLLAANGFQLADRQKARSDGAHEADLLARMNRVLAVEAKFESSNISAVKRRKLRAQLAYEYDSLTDAAGRYRDDADAAYDAALTAEAQRIRTVNPTVKELFKGGNPWKAAKPAIVFPDRFGKFTDAETYAEAVRARYKKLYKEPAAVASGLSQLDQARLQDEKDGVTAQLAAWSTKRYDAPGCNINGTWGTSKGGAGGSFAASHLNTKVWAELRTWWQAKPGAYITPSDTTTWSLKKYRNLPANSQLSATFNYHVFVP